MADYSRLEIMIDVFEHAQQRALPLPSLYPNELIAATLDEFHEVSYMGNQASQYELIDTANGEPLHDDAPLHEQIGNNAHLVLRDRRPAPPAGTETIDRPVYLREMQSGTVYKLHWSPTIIGRSDKNMQDEDRLLANFEGLPLGLRISRRHARIVAKDNQFYVSQLSRNPTVVITANDERVPLDTGQWRLQHGDRIKLVRSGVELKFIERHEVTVDG